MNYRTLIILFLLNPFFAYSMQDFLVPIKHPRIKQEARNNETVLKVEKWLERHKPLVSKDINGMLTLDETITPLVPILTLFNDMAYALGKEKNKTSKEEINGKLSNYRKYFEKKKWHIDYIEGITGSTEENQKIDTPVVFGYHRKTNVMVICFRGSQNNLDWKANLSRRTISSNEKDHPLFGYLPPEITTHHAYSFRTKGSIGKIIDQINYLVKSHQIKLSTLRIVFTGHSQGSALGTLALAAAVHTSGPKLYGEEFSNARQNNFLGYFFSTPRSLNGQGSAKAINALVGDNIVNQNVEGDPVTRLNSNRLGNWWDVGFVALDQNAIGRKLLDLEEEFIGNKKGFIDNLMDKYAPLHYGSASHKTSNEDRDLIFDPLLADSTGTVAGLMKEIHGIELIEHGSNNNSIFMVVDSKNLTSVNTLLEQGKSYKYWYSPKN